MKKLAMLALSVVLAFGFVACGDDDELPVMFTADPSSPLKVNNMVNTELVLYAAKGVLPGTPIGNLLGGVKGMAQGHGVPNISTADGLMVLNVVTHQDYKEAQRAGISPRIASSVLVYVDGNGTATYPISSGAVGDAGVQISNQTDNYVEFRGGTLMSGPSVYSSPFTVIRPREMKRLYINPDDYAFFPIIKFARKSGNEIIGMVEKELDMASLVQGYTGYYSVTSGSLETIEIPKSAEQSGTQVSTFLTVVNNRGALQLRIGTKVFTTATGRELAASGSTEYVYSVPGALSNPNAKAELLIAGYGANMGKLVEMATPYEFQAGQVYTVTIPLQSNVITVSHVGPFASEDVVPGFPAAQ